MSLLINKSCIFNECGGLVGVWWGAKVRVIALFALLCVVEKVRKKFAKRLENACKKTRKCSETDRHKDRRLNWICQLNDGKVLQVWHAGAGQKAYIRHA